MPALAAISNVVNVLYRRLAPKSHATQADMSGRKAVVTGVSPSSIGYAVAKTLVAWGADVVGTNLDQDVEITGRMRRELEQVGEDPQRINVRPLDLCDPKSVYEFADWYRNWSNEELHLLINNAGVFKDFTMQSRDPLLATDGEEIHWRTNFLGTFHLTYALIPLLRTAGRRSGDARVIFLASDTHERINNEELFSPSPGNYKSWDAYGRSKLALIHLSNEIQRRYAENDNLRTASLHPGTTDTGLIAEGLQSNTFLRSLNPLLAPVMGSVFQTLDQGAQTPLHCATCVPFRGGEYYDRCRVARASAATRDAQAGMRLWAYAEKWVNAL